MFRQNVDRRKLGIAVGYVRATLCRRKRVDDVAERRERAIDHFGLVELLARRTGLAHHLAPRQVDEVHAAGLGALGLGVALMDLNAEARVRARRPGVHALSENGRALSRNEPTLCLP